MPFNWSELYKLGKHLVKEEFGVDIGPLFEDKVPQPAAYPADPLKVAVLLPAGHCWLDRDQVRTFHTFLNDYDGPGEFAKDLAVHLQSKGVSATCEETPTA